MFELTRRISAGSQSDCRRRRYRHVDCRLVGRLSITRLSPGRVNFIFKVKILSLIACGIFNTQVTGADKSH